jgi:hypothetical protein
MLVLFRVNELKLMCVGMEFMSSFINLGGIVQIVYRDRGLTYFDATAVHRSLKQFRRFVQSGKVQSASTEPFGVAASGLYSGVTSFESCSCYQLF